jgi:imidazolonepropionase-like amidohydrolase
MITLRIRYTLFVFTCCIKAYLAQHMAYINADIHVGNGTRINPGILITQSDTIESVISQQGFKINPASFDSIIDLSGQHVYPALINPNSILGLHDAEAVRASRDFEDVGEYNPHLRTQMAFNTDNPILPTVRRNGVLLTQVTPRGGRISGQSSIMALTAWNWEDATVLKDDGMHINFPEYPQTSGELYDKQLKQYTSDLEQLNRMFDQARSYCTASSQYVDIRLQALCACLKGAQRVYIHVHYARDILAAIQWIQTQQLLYPVLVEAEDAWKVTHILKAHQIPVLLSRVFALPEHPDDPIDLPFSTAYKLFRDSVRFAFQCAGDMEAMQARNLCFMAGQAVAYGLPQEHAIQAMTQHAAEILGISSKWGSLASGKKACFFVSKGSILDVKTHQVTRMVWNGNAISIDSHQEQRAEEYRKKYKLQQWNTNGR